MNKYLIARLNLGLTKARVSRDTGIAEWTIKRIEEGKKTRKSTLDLIEKYYKNFNDRAKSFFDTFDLIENDQVIDEEASSGTVLLQMMTNISGEDIIRKVRREVSICTEQYWNC